MVFWNQHRKIHKMAKKNSKIRKKFFDYFCPKNDKKKLAISQKLGNFHLDDVCFFGISVKNTQYDRKKFLKKVKKNYYFI